MIAKTTAWTLTWLTVAGLTLHSVATSNWDAAVPLAVLQFGPAIYAGQAYDKENQ